VVAEPHRDIIDQLRHLKAFQLPITAVPGNQSSHDRHAGLLSFFLIENGHIVGREITSAFLSSV
jgi:hypothetical protein